MQDLIRRLNLESRLDADSIHRSLLQCGMATLVVLVLLLVLDSVTQTVLIAALGASTFIAFAVPRSLVSTPRHLIGGYCVGLVAGCSMSVLDSALPLASAGAAHAATIACGAIAIGIAMFLMVVTRTEHPPAAALALGLVLNEWDLLTLAVVIGGIVALNLLKALVLPLLMDLV